MRSQTDGLTLGQALALGALHGPAELLPISSSAHTSAIPWLLGWRYDELDPSLQKSFEVALHAGTTLALVIGLRAELSQAARELDARALRVLALSTVTPAIAGLALEREIERRLGTPPTIAAALAVGALAMALADHSAEDRCRDEATAWDGLWLGVAQASALVPGISRAGATLSAARLLRFRARDAQLLSDEVALPVLAGAALLKAVRLRRRGLGRRTALTFAVGAGAAFASTLTCVAPTRRGARVKRLWPYASYRIALASLILARQTLGRGDQRQGHTGSA